VIKAFYKIMALLLPNSAFIIPIIILSKYNMAIQEKHQKKVKPPGENPKSKISDLAPLGLSSEHPLTTGNEDNFFMETLPLTLPLSSKKA
jgi:hypothetical protein